MLRFVWLALGIGATVGWWSDRPLHTPAEIAPALQAGLVALREGGAGWAGENPVACAVWLVVVLGPCAGWVVAQLAPESRQRDPQRLFDAAQRRVGMDRAQGRCEMETWVMTRCRRAASHGDHWVPWSRGGATSMENFVAACSGCNLSKSSHMPTGSQTWRLQQRRRRYFPPGISTRPGARVLA